MAFGLVHAWLTWLGVVVVPAEAFHDVDLYRWWMHLAVQDGDWPVLTQPWVYPAGALLPLLLPALVTTTSTVGYALAWCALVTALDAVAVGVLLRSGRSRGVWWWLGFLVLLGPVAVGRLDAVVAPLVVIALTLGLRRPALATALLTTGAWIKVAPGALVLALLATARRPLTQVVAPAVAVCAAVVTVVAGFGGAAYVASFVTTQTGRGLQVESITATPWVLAALARDDVSITLNAELITYEVVGPGTTVAATVLDAVLVLLVLGIGALLLMARHRGTAAAAFLPAATTLLVVLVVANKVGSPQFLTWLAAPLAVLLTVPGPPGRAPSVRTGAALLLAAAALTQVVFPWGYLGLLSGEALLAVVLAVRNLCLVALLAWSLVLLVRSLGRAHPAGAAVADRQRA